MKEISKFELKSIRGGVGIWTIISAIAGIIFGSGILDGQIKLKWQKLKNTVFKGNFVEKPSIQIHQEDAIMYIKL